MKRDRIAELIRWKDSPDRKPLVMRGARQVGKTFLIQDFGNRYFENTVYLNFEKQPEIASLFVSKSPDKICRLLELQFNTTVHPGRTLLFLDEIQAAGELLEVLRYFHEEKSDLHVVAAGSLLEFVLSDHAFSMPVGRIEYHHLGPMTFEEYLCAAGQTQFAEFVRSYSLGDEVPLPVHNALMEHVRIFCAVGGMPAVTVAWLKRLSFGDCDAIKQSLLSTLEDDFGKYGTRLAREHLVKVFRKLPLLVSQRFKYVHVSREERARTIRSALDLLCDARLGYRVCHSSCNGVPLRAEVKEEIFKMLFLDVGLMTGACGLSLLDFEKAGDLVLVNQGAMSEQFVGQHLLHSQPSYKPPELHYWVREKSSSSAEVDYVVALGSDIVPIEVKAGKTGRLRSLQLFMDKQSCNVAVRFNSDLPSVVNSPILGSGTSRGTYRLISLPFYLIGQFQRIVTG